VQRRDFIRLISGVVVWPLAARAQQPERPRRIGVLLPASQSDSEYPGLVEAFLRDGCLKTSVNDSDFLDCSEARIGLDAIYSSCHRAAKMSMKSHRLFPARPSLRRRHRNGSNWDFGCLGVPVKRRACCPRPVREVVVTPWLRTSGPQSPYRLANGSGAAGRRCSRLRGSCRR